MKSSLHVAARATVTAALSLALVGAAAAPALADEGWADESRLFGSGYPTKADCDADGSVEMREHNADRWACYHQPNNTWNGYLYWNT